MDVSIIIVNYNTKDLTRNCLKSVFEQTKNITFEVIVSDNGSIDGSIEMIKSEFPQVVLIENNANLGFGKANNIGSKNAIGKYLFFLNSDTLLTSNVLELFIKYANTHENEFGIIGGNLINANGKPVHSCRKNYSIENNEFKKIFDNIYLKIKKQRRDYNYLSKPLEVDFVPGADMFIKKDFFINIGGFDESFFMYYEDFDLCIRCKENGKKIISLPTVKIAHLEGASSKDNLKKYEMITKSKYHLYKKYVPKSFFFLHFLCQLKYILLIIVQRKIAIKKIKINYRLYKDELLH